MTPLTIIGLIANQVTMTIAVALSILVLWQSRQRTNLILATFLDAIAVAMFGLIAFRASAFLDYASKPWFHLDVMAIGIYGILFFVFTAEFTGKNGPLARAGYLAGVMAWLVTLWLVLTDHIVDFLVISQEGETLFELTPVGFTMLVILLGFEVAALLNLAVRATPLSRSLIPAALLMIGASITDAIPALNRYPSNSVLITIALLSLATVVMQENLFNPLTRLNADLSEANQELARASELKSQFLANMSHELRTPMNSIIGYTELVLSGLYGSLTNVQRDRLNKVLTNGQNLLSLINDILDLSKIEAGRIDLQLQPQDVQMLVDTAVEGVMPQVQEKGLDLFINLSPELPYVQADQTRLHQIILNLLSNAVKFTDEGRVTVEAAHDVDQNLVAIRVTDTGIGIPTDKQEEIFDEFRQADNTTTRKYGGTGLGLAISRRLARLHGGDLLVESAAGVGSTFITLIPAAPARGHPVRIYQTQDGSGPLALVIDDEEEAADIIRENLAAAGYRVEIAHNGRTGLERARESQPDIITLDVLMPGVDGWQILSDLKNDARTVHIPVVIVSIIDSVPSALRMNVSEHVIKPINRDQLLGSINRALVGSSPQYPILIVDDNPDDRDLMSTILSSAGHSVVVVEGGQAAIEWLEEHVARLVLLDLTMPGVSGFDVLGHVRSHKTTQDLPVIVVSARELTPDEEDFLEARFADMVRKEGMGRRDLLEEITRVLGQ